MSVPLRVLIVEDSEEDALLDVEELRRSGFDPLWQRVDTAEEMEAALERGGWELILCDHSMPQFNARMALQLVQARDLDVPFILVSGSVGEEVAVEVVRAGAHDFVLKDKLWRLGPAADRELRTAELRRQKHQAEIAFHESERRTRSIFDQASDAIVIAFPFGQILDANPAAQRLLGYSLEEARQMSFVAVTDREDVRTHPLQLPTAPAESTHTRRLLVRKDGSRFPADVSATMLDDGRLLLIARDITAEIAAEEATKRRERQQRALAELSRVAMHGVAMPEVMRLACEAASAVLQMEFCVVVECASDGTPLIRSSIGWPSEKCGDIARHIPWESEEPLPFLASSGDPQRSDLTEEGIVSGIEALIGTTQRRLGGIALHSRSPHRVDNDDIAFIRTVAITLAEAIDRRRAEEGRLRSEHILSEAQRIAHIGSWCWIVAENRFEASDETFRIFGLVPQSERPTADEALEKFAPESRQEVVDAFRRAAHGASFDLRFMVVRPTGEKRWLHVEAEPEGGSAGRPERVFGFAEDITEEVLSKEALFRREEELRAVVETSPDMIARFDRDGRMLFVSPAIESMLGIPAEECIGMRVRELDLPRQVRDTFEAALQSIFETQAEVAFETWRDSPAGDRIYLQARIVPELGPGGSAEFAVCVVNDVTHLHEILTSLRDSKEQLARAQQIASVGSWEKDLVNGRRVWSDQVFRLLGLPVGETPKQADVDSWIHPDDREAAEAAEQRAIATGEPQIIEHRMTVADGSEQVFVVHLDTSKDAAGKPVKVTGTVQNVTTIRRIEESLRRSEKQLRALFETANDAIVTLDKEGRVLQMNPAVTRLTGISPEMALGHSLLEFVHPDDVARIAGEVRNVVQSGRRIDVEGRVVAADGRFVHLEATASLRTGDGDPAVFVIARDVTERRRAQAEREALTREIQLLLESTYEGIIAIDTSCRCTLVNRAACAMLGYTSGQLLGKKIHDLIHHHDARGAVMPSGQCRIMSTAEAPRRENVLNEVFWRADGTFFPVEVLASSIQSEGTEWKGIVISFTDATEKLLLRDELERANRLTSLGRVAATMSHEFNNVLMGIQPFAEALGRRTTDEKVLEATRHIRESVKRGRRVTQEVLRFTRPAEPSRKPVLVQKWLSDCATELCSLLPARIRLDVDVAPDTLAAEIDRDQITQVVTNMVINARDAIAEKNGTIRVSARPPSGTRFSFGIVPDTEKLVHLCIRDDGPGIAAADLQHVFEPFFTTKKSGTGLGLAVAHQVVRLHGGHIFAESTPGAGTAFHLFLPRSMETEATPGQRRSAGSRTLPHRVLVVEDEEAVRIGIASLLENESIAVEAATTGAEALDYLASKVPDALILDVGLPDTNGIDLYERIRKSHPQMPVVFSSGYADRARIEGLSREAPVRLLLKPYDGDDLLDALEQACADANSVTA